MAVPYCQFLHVARYRQIRKLRTVVLNFCIFGNDVKYLEFKTTERSEGVLKFGTSR